MTGIIKNCRKAVPNFLGPLSAKERRDLANNLGREGFDKHIYITAQSEGLYPFNLEIDCQPGSLAPPELRATFHSLARLFWVPEIVPELLARSLPAVSCRNSPRTHRRPFDTACCYGQLGFPRHGPDHHCRSVAVPSGGGFGTGRGSSLFLAFAGWYWSERGGKKVVYTNRA